MKNKTDITFILDRSGSMYKIRDDTIGGFNSFISDQQKEKGEAVVSLYQFDDQYQVDYEAKDLKDVEGLNTNTFVPRGNTALYDALGKTIVKTGERLSAINESERPDKVVLVVLTDGQENYSKEYNSKKIAEMIKHQQDFYNWKFMFLGANQDAILAARTIGIAKDYSLTFAADGDGVKSAYGATSEKLKSFRSTYELGVFTAEDRTKQAR